MRLANTRPNLGPHCRIVSAGSSDAAAVAGDCRLRHLRRHQPDVEGVAIEDRHVATFFPAAQRGDLAKYLLPRREVDILVLIAVLAVALGRDVIMPGRNIAIEHAAVGDSPK